MSKGVTEMARKGTVGGKLVSLSGHFEIDQLEKRFEALEDRVSVLEFQGLEKETPTNEEIRDGIKRTDSNVQKITNVETGIASDKIITGTALDDILLTLVNNHKEVISSLEEIKKMITPKYGGAK